MGFNVSVVDNQRPIIVQRAAAPLLHPLASSSPSSRHFYEDVIDQLEELLPDSTSPSCAYSFFISQNWEGGTGSETRAPKAQINSYVRGRPHPDNSQNTKVLGLESIVPLGINISVVDNQLAAYCPTRRHPISTLFASSPSSLS